MLFALLLVVGLYFSRALLSISPYAMLAIGLLRPNLSGRIKSFWHIKPYLALACLLLIYIMSGINSSDTFAWLQRVENNLAFLVLPLAFALNAPFESKRLKQILYCFFAFSCLVALGTLMNYYFNYDQINSNYLHGKTIVTPIHHPKFSMFLATAALCGFYLWIDKFTWRFSWERNLQLLGVTFIAIFMHILAVRTGLLSFYTGILFTIYTFVLRRGRYAWTLALLAAIVLIPIISFYTIPSFKNKILYVKTDWDVMLKNKKREHFSDNIRVRSVGNGIDLLRESPLFGVGVGDLRAEMDKKYEEKYPQMLAEERFLPINQIVFLLAGIGAIGTLVYLLVWLYPLWFQSNYRSYFLTCFYLLIVVTFIGENTLELQRNNLFFCLIAVVGISLLNANKTTPMPWLEERA